MPVPTEGQSKNKKSVSWCCCCPKKTKNKTKIIENITNTIKVPYCADLPQPLAVGKAVCVTGLILPNCSRFAVNLTCGKGPTTDIALHFNPRLAQKYVVRNSRLNGRWGEEETVTPSGIVLAPNKNFELILLVGEEEFLVALNGVHFCCYKFRVPVSKITGVEVDGNVEVSGVECKQLKIFPEPVPENKTFTAIVGRRRDEDETQETATDTPVTFLLPRGFQQDWQLEIYGRVKILPHSFYVNLQEGAHHWPHPIIPLHLNPRFSTVFGEHLFVRNAWIDGGWGQEERAPGFQFSPGSPFTIAIRRGNDHFSVWIDGKLVGEFKFRGTVDKIDTVYIYGDVVVYRVAVDETTN